MIPDFASVKCETIGTRENGRIDVLPAAKRDTVGIIL